MADLSITETPLADGKIRYTLGSPNWQDRRMPDIRRSGSTVQIDEQRLIDVVILGDGFTSSADFRATLADWITDFFVKRARTCAGGNPHPRALHALGPVGVAGSQFDYRCR